MYRDDISRVITLPQDMNLSMHARPRLLIQLST